MKSTIKKPVALLLALLLTLTSVMLSTVNAFAATNDTLTVNVTSNIFPDQTKVITDFLPYQDDQGDAYVTVEYKLLGADMLLVNFQGVLTWDYTVLEFKEDYNKTTFGSRKVLNVFPFSVSQNLGPGTVNTFDDGNTGRIACNYSSVQPAAFADEEDGSAVTVVKAVFRVLNRNAEVTVNLDVNTLALCDASLANEAYTQSFLVNNNVVNENGADLATCTTEVTDDYTEDSGSDPGESDYDENLKYTGRFLVLLDAVEVVYVVPAANISDYTDPVLSVKNLYESDSVTNDYAGELNNTSGNYEFKFKVAPGYIVDDMGLTMRATRKSDNKTVTGLQRVDSVYTYAYTALDIYQNYSSLPGYPELLSTMVDMLNYAAAVQQLGGHHKEKLANDNIAQYQKFSLTENFTPEDKNGNMNVLTTDPIFAIGGTGLKFDENITPRFQVNLAAGQDASTLRWSEDYYLEVKVGSKNYQLTTPVETKINEGHYQYSMFEFNDLMANQLDKELYITVRETATGVAVSDTYQYTANSYLPRYLAYYNQYGYTPDAKIVAVTAAMARYGESTRQYALKQGLL